ncbi:metallophosphoesterase family protein [Actinomadura parmotrematis]|uniref:Metallophosphoesterase n=1 Tax=Actinomadura parmotrematis TaxID=2864039 RepID=A0ABS7FPY6_9ACTN|nr:metallophosphoesterase [Actinomadura parmotrematis]MBW8482474.1 metallophosphoesterase [Actinomadura parmotrematis]
MRHENSRTSEAGAGWVCQRPGRFEELLPERVPRFSWRHPAVLWRARNDVVARLFGDPSDDIRRRVLAELGERGVPAGFTVHRGAEAFSFLVMGDTGEGDRSQYAVVPPLEAVAPGTDFLVIASDVIYPTGDAGDYPEKFFRPYRGYPGPIFAVPGNHDWYDGLRGFLRIFCGVDADCAPPPWTGPFARLATLLWRRSGPVDGPALDAARDRYRGAPGQRGAQPGPYWAIDTPSLRVVGIDTGILGGIDRDQAAWLREVSAGPKPKVLITGKPIYVDDEHHPGPVEGGGTVDAIVADPACNYVAAIGGDIHNYQRYPVRVGDRTIQYIVSGGGGAFMHATHTIPKVGSVEEDDFRLYPLRGDSLSRYSRLYGRVTRMPWFWELTPKEAARVVRHRLGIRPARGYAEDGPDGIAARPSTRARLVAVLLGVPRGRTKRFRLLRLPVHRTPQRFRSEMADWDHAPFFKHLLRLDVTPDALRIRCHAVTGCGDHEADPPVEDEVTISLR